MPEESERALQTPRESDNRTLNVLIQQPALPAYRIPVFRLLEQSSGMHIRVRHGDRALAPTVEAEGFEHDLCRDWELPPKSLEFRWSSAQWQGAARGACDVLVLEWNLRLLSLLPAMLRARLNGIGVVLWGHGRSRRATWWRRAMRNLIGSLADSIVVYSHRGKGFLMEAGYRADRVFVAQNTQDQRPIQDARKDWLSRPTDLRAFQEREGIADRPVLLFSSTLMIEKRPDLLIDATAALVKRGINPVAVFIGDGPMRAELASKAARLGIESNVRFLGGVYGEPMIAPWFLSAAVFCHPRTIGLSILHAFGYGTPVVTSDHMPSHHPEFGAFRNEHTGLLFKDGDAADLANVVERLIRDRDLRERCSLEARRVATEDFTLPIMVSGLDSAIRHAAARRGRVAMPA